MEPLQAHENGSFSQSPQFFKALFPNALVHLLMIPREFHNYLPSKLPKSATLSIQNGTSYQVEVHQNGGNIWFRRGWYEFARAHDLCTGYFLVFRYEGNMIFNVTIFDGTGCLKEYVRSPSKKSNPEPESCYIEIDGSSESSAKSDSDGSEETNMPNTKAREVQSKNKQTIREKQGSSSYPQFEKILRPHHKYQIALPMDFSMKNRLDKRKDIFLKRKLEGHSWQIHVSVRNPQDVRLCKGWKIFTKENGFKEGDHLSFEMVSKDVILVSKIRIQTNALDGQIRIQTNALDGETSTVVKSYNLKCNYMYVGGNIFGMKNNRASCRDVILKDLEGREWPVTYSYRNRQGRFVGEGWKTFSTENGLKEGDMCIYKRIAEDTVLVRVVKAECQ